MKLVVLLLICLGLLVGGCASKSAPVAALPAAPDVVHRPYELDLGVQTRSISFENPTGAPGEGGKTASRLGVGRKGHAARGIAAGKTVELADIAGPGMIRHIWMTTHTPPVVMRSLVVRMYWEGQSYPSVECPYADFFGSSHGHVVPYQSAVHSVSEKGGMNIWLPMPFTKHARITISNDGKTSIPLYYQIDYTIGDKLAEDVGRLHTLFRRENPTTEKKDFELLPVREGKGRYIGSLIGIRNLHDHWWGEGEVKMYLDDDQDFPTYCGTGAEDYVGHAYGVQNNPFLYNGCSFTDHIFSTVYRWHLPDPVVWSKRARITIQQIRYDKGLKETSDDWSCATFWYEPTPSKPLPPMPDVAARTADLWKEDAKPATRP